MFPVRMQATTKLPYYKEESCIDAVNPLAVSRRIMLGR